MFARWQTRSHSKFMAAFCLTLAVALFAIACAGASPQADPATPVPLGGPDVSVTVVNTDLATGERIRVAFGLIDRDGFPVRAEQAQVRSVYLPEGQELGELRQTTTANFVHWPGGVQGVFVTRLDLDTTGFWGLEVTLDKENGTPVVARGAFRVNPFSQTPAIGDMAPASVTPTVADVPDLAMISSAVEPDEDLYQLSVHEALKAGKPFVVVFATPAFCVSATCGPQVEILSEIKGKYREQANFIHVEVFNDPHLIQGGRPTTGYVEAVDEWGLPTEPWTFVMDGEGRVRAKFEQFTTGGEIEEALLQVLQATG